MLRVLPSALLVTALLWVSVAYTAPARRIPPEILYILLPIALCVFAIGLKRWIQSRRDPHPPLPRLAGDGPSRDPLRYLNVAGNVVRVVLFFVVFGMFVGLYGTTMTPSVGVELAKTVSATEKPKANREDAIVIGVERDGKVYLSNEDWGSMQIRPELLRLSISNSVQSGAEKRVYIKADARARYRMVKDILDATRSAGIENITFIVEKTKPQTVAD